MTHPNAETGRPLLLRALPWLVTASTVVVTAWAILVSPAEFGDVTAAPLPTFFALLGALIVTRRPGNRIAWLFLAIGPAFLLEPVGMILVAHHPEPPSFWIVMALAGVNSSFFIVSSCAFLVLYLFPDGHFLTRRWSWAGWMAVGLSAEVFLVHLFADTVGLSEFPDQDWSTRNPFGFIPARWWSEGTEPGPLQFVFGLAITALILGAIPAVVVRYRRSSGHARDQIKWVIFAFVVFVITFAVNLYTPGEGDIFGVLMSVSMAMIPVVMTAAIVRRRLYDIDRVISRTLAYSLTLAVLGGVYALGAIWLPTRLIGEQPSMFVAASTLVAASLFNPVRRRILSAVDRRFNRAQYDAKRVVDRFADRLQVELGLRQLTAECVEVVAEVIEPSAVGVWVRDPGSDVQGVDGGRAGMADRGPVRGGEPQDETTVFALPGPVVEVDLT